MDHFAILQVGAHSQATARTEQDEEVKELRRKLGEAETQVADLLKDVIKLQGEVGTLKAEQQIAGAQANELAQLKADRESSKRDIVLKNLLMLAVQFLPTKTPVPFALAQMNYQAVFGSTTAMPNQFWKDFQDLLPEDLKVKNTSGVSEA